MLPCCWVAERADAIIICRYIIYLLLVIFAIIHFFAWWIISPCLWLFSLFVTPRLSFVAAIFSDAHVVSCCRAPFTLRCHTPLPLPLYYARCIFRHYFRLLHWFRRHYRWCHYDAHAAAWLCRRCFRFFFLPFSSFSSMLLLPCICICRAPCRHAMLPPPLHAQYLTCCLPLIPSSFDLFSSPFHAARAFLLVADMPLWLDYYADAAIADAAPLFSPFDAALSCFHADYYLHFDAMPFSSIFLFILLSFADAIIAAFFACWLQPHAAAAAIICYCRWCRHFDCRWWMLMPATFACHFACFHFALFASFHDLIFSIFSPLIFIAFAAFAAAAAMPRLSWCHWYFLLSLFSWCRFAFAWCFRRAAALITLICRCRAAIALLSFHAMPFHYRFIMLTLLFADAMPDALSRHVFADTLSLMSLASSPLLFFSFSFDFLCCRYYDLPWCRWCWFFCLMRRCCHWWCFRFDMLLLLLSFSLSFYCFCCCCWCCWYWCWCLPLAIELSDYAAAFISSFFRWYWHAAADIIDIFIAWRRFLFIFWWFYFDAVFAYALMLIILFAIDAAIIYAAAIRFFHYALRHDDFAAISLAILISIILLFLPLPCFAIDFLHYFLFSSCRFMMIPIFHLFCCYWLFSYLFYFHFFFDLFRRLLMILLLLLLPPLRFDWYFHLPLFSLLPWYYWCFLLSFRFRHWCWLPMPLWLLRFITHFFAVCYFAARMRRYYIDDYCCYPADPAYYAIMRAALYYVDAMPCDMQPLQRAIRARWLSAQARADKITTCARVIMPRAITSFHLPRRFER